MFDNYIPRGDLTQDFFAAAEDHMRKGGALSDGESLGFTFITKQDEYFELECVGPINGKQFIVIAGNKIIKKYLIYPYQLADRSIIYRLSMILGVTMSFVMDFLRGLQLQLSELKKLISQGERIPSVFLAIGLIPREVSGTTHADLIQLTKRLGTTLELLPEKAQSMAVEYNTLMRQEFTNRGKKIEDTVAPLPPDFYASMTAKFRSIFHFGRLWVERGVFDDGIIQNPRLHQLQHPDPGERRSMIYPGWNADTWAYIDALFLNPSFLSAQIRAGTDFHEIYMAVNMMYMDTLMELTKGGDPPASLVRFNRTNRSMDHPRSDMGAKLAVMKLLLNEGYSNVVGIPSLYKTELSRIEKTGKKILKTLAKK